MHDLGKFDHARVWNQVGTLGGGNHFIELCLDESDRVWVMLHSGSRNVGNRIGEVSIAIARATRRARRTSHLPDRDLAWLDRRQRRIRRLRRRPALGAGLRGAQPRRDAARRARRRLRVSFRSEIAIRESAVNCHHNYADVEEHFGAQAVDHPQRRRVARARTSSASSPAAWARARSSCAARATPRRITRAATAPAATMSRNEARRRYTRADLAAQTAGVECRKDDGRARRDAGGVQGHRRGHGGAVRPGRSRPHAEAGALRQGLMRGRCGARRVWLQSAHGPARPDRRHGRPPPGVGGARGSDHVPREADGRVVARRGRPRIPRRLAARRLPFADLSTKSILAIKGSAGRPLSHTPGLTNPMLFARDRQVCAYCGGRFLYPRSFARSHHSRVARRPRHVDELGDRMPQLQHAQGQPRARAGEHAAALRAVRAEPARALHPAQSAHPRRPDGVPARGRAAHEPAAPAAARRVTRARWLRVPPRRFAARLAHEGRQVRSMWQCHCCFDSANASAKGPATIGHVR